MIVHLLPIVFLLHCVEEWAFGFPEWAVRHFGGITTRKFYLVSHIPLFAIVCVVSLGKGTEHSVLQFCWLTVLMVIFTNGLTGCFT